MNPQIIVESPRLRGEIFQSIKLEGIKKMEKKEADIDFLVQWAVWAHLDNKKDLELILLKGHLILESLLRIVLGRFNVQHLNELSFHKKIIELEKCLIPIDDHQAFIVSSLRGLNKLRNVLAHEFHYKIDNCALENWAGDIMGRLNGEKFSRYTFRTKIVHAFSVLSKSMLDASKKAASSNGENVQ